MKMTRLGSALVPALFVLGLGCGDDDGGSGTVNLGGDDSRVIEDLDGDEAVQLCENLDTATDKIDLELTPEQTCNAGGALAGKDTAACESLRDMCLMNPDPGDDDEDPEDPEDEVDCTNAQADAAGCKATVGELEACLNAFIAQFDRFRNLTCADAGKYTQADFISQPEQCEAAMAKCPDLLSEDEEGGEVQPSIKLLRTLRRLQR